MAYSPIGTENVKGCFTESDFGKHFEYTDNPEFVLHVPAHGGKLTQFPHLVFVGPTGTETRRALVKKSVVHIVVDETGDGFVVEKWDIKNHRKYRN